MSKKIFNPKDWAMATPTQSLKSFSFNNDLETVTERIEETHTDIAPNYADWRDLGFALADALGESGRAYYHRLSRFYSGYTETETSKQFDNCLKSNGHGVTIKTLFHLAKQAGIEIAIKNQGSQRNSTNHNSDNISNYPNIQKGKMAKRQGHISNSIETMTNVVDISHSEMAKIEQEIEKLPTFPSEIYNQLPDFFKKITNYSHSPEDADLLLLGSITALSACFPNVYGIYGGVTVYPNLFLFVTAQASAGKGRLSLCRRLVEPIHKQLREINRLEIDEYKRQQAKYAVNKKNPDVEQPLEPPLRVLFIPANSSATAVFQILNENKGVGLMFETEGDTLAQTFKTEHGNYSDGFRKAFHHEKISYLRRKDREYVTLETPKLSTLLSGTPRQIRSLIPDTENGLFSRFLFYCLNMRLEWMDVFATKENELSLDKVFDILGNNFFEFYQILQNTGEIKFTFTAQQQRKFNTYFSEIQKQYYAICGQDYIGTVRRLGLIAFRIALILSVIRIMQTGYFATLLVCDDIDFDTSIKIINILIQHTEKIFNELKPTTNQIMENPKTLLLQMLPETFDRQKYIDTAKQINIPESTADKQIARYIKQGLLHRSTHGKYDKKNISNQNQNANF